MIATTKHQLTTVDSRADDYEWLGSRLYTWFANPRRRLPTGPLLGELAGDDIHEYDEHVQGTLGGLLVQADTLAVSGSLWRSALHGVLACSHWWGAPSWPQLVENCVGETDPVDSMTAEDVASLIAELGDIAEALVVAEPEHKLDLYRSLRLRLTYTAETQTVRTAVDLGEPVGVWCVSGSTQTNTQRQRLMLSTLIPLA